MRLSAWKPTGEQACPCRQSPGLELTQVHLDRRTAAQGRAAGARLGRVHAVADFTHSVGHCQHLPAGHLHTAVASDIWGTWVSTGDMCTTGSAAHTRGS